MRYRRPQDSSFVLVPVLVALFFAWPAAGASWLAPTIPNVTVQDQDGQDYRFSDLLQGRRVLLDFIYTSCKTTCPTQTAVLREVRNQLNRNGSDDREVLLISVTVDPHHDGPQALRRYAAQFGIDPGISHGWIFLTGSSPELNKLLAAFGSATGRPSDHANVLWIGNQPHQRWTRTSAFNEPQQITHLLQQVSR